MLEFAIGYAESGYPLHERIRATIELNEELLASWPGSRELYVPAPVAGELFRNPALATTYRRIVDESRGGSREEEIEKSAPRLVRRLRRRRDRPLLRGRGRAPDGSGPGRLARHPGARRDLRLPRPDGLQDAALGDRPGRAPAARAPRRATTSASFRPHELVHVVVECGKLAFADRDALYGDAEEVPLERLLSKAYNDERRALVGEDASAEYRPGIGRLPSLHAVAATVGSGEPGRGTVHLDIADRFGNLISATPSGGWLQSSPVIPALGWPLGTRAQMFWLEDGLASSLRPGTRPRTTLSPGLALRDGAPYLAWGTPGGDQQEQWAHTRSSATSTSD